MQYLSKTFVAIVLGCCLIPTLSHAQSDPAEYNRRLKAYQTITPGGDTPFGEQINAYTGELSFMQTDVVVEGQGPSIVLARTTRTSQQDKGWWSAALGNWDISIPRIETLANSTNTNSSSPGELWVNKSTSRCTAYGKPVSADFWWHGVELVTEHGDRKLLLKRTAENTFQPAMTDANGQPMVFPVVTIDQWQIGCLPTTANGEVGEAFLAISPDGTKYWLNYLIGSDADPVKEDEAGGLWIQRMFVQMLVTRIEDRFGNWLQYQYNASHQLTSITASDGRLVTLTWRSDAPVINTITVHNGSGPVRTWQYQYQLIYIGGTSIISGAELTSVVLPDNSSWQFSGALASIDAPSDSNARLCTRPGSLYLPTGVATGTIVSPTGAVGTFKRKATWHARSYVASTCWHDQVANKDFESTPPLFASYSLIERSISGPGIQTATWTYSYDASNPSTTHDPCASTNTCPDTAVAYVVGPNEWTRHTFSNRWGVTEGKEVKTELYQGTSTLLRTDLYTYAQPNQGPWPTRVGYSLLSAGANYAKLEQITPVIEHTVVQQGRAFKRIVNTFDAVARPTKVTRTSLPAP